MTHSGGKPHATGDKGQRYEVTFEWIRVEGTGRSVFGWSDTLDGAQSMCKSIELHPRMENPRIWDRERGAYVVEMAT